MQRRLKQVKVDVDDSGGSVELSRDTSIPLDAFSPPAQHASTLLQDPRLPESDADSQKKLEGRHRSPGEEEIEVVREPEESEKSADSHSKIGYVATSTRHRYLTINEHRSHHPAACTRTKPMLNDMEQSPEMQEILQWLGETIHY